MKKEIRGAVLGGDVSKSRSPAIHEAAFRALGWPGTYQAHSVDGRGFRPLVRRLAAEGIGYVNVTIPHKRAAAQLADRSSPLVRATGAANTLIFKRAPRGQLRIQAENTDGYGLVTALAALGVSSLKGRTVVMVGAGGAAAGGVAALVLAGARVEVLARRAAAASGLRRRLPLKLRAHVEARGWTMSHLQAALVRCDVLVSAVPASAWDAAEIGRALLALRPGTVVLEMAYGGKSALRRWSKKRGAAYQDGLPMLVFQAARAVELALGVAAPVTAMWKAVEA